jgi:CheY-like chemotaxis protein
VSKQILVVDDDEAIRLSLSEALEFEGYEVVCVDNGRSALEYLQNADPPCVVLLDVMMPVMDGGALRQAMLNNPKLAAIPVVLITAGGAQVAARVPANDVIYKPLRIDAVLNSISRHCPDQ